jgi:hypothetical protein
MDRVPGSAYRYAPDGLVGKALDDLITRAYAEVANAPVPTSALLDGNAAEQRRRRTERLPVATRRVLLVGRARRAGAPESLTEAIEEIGMLQVHSCVNVRCAQCGDSLGSSGSEAHFATEDAALDAAAAKGWLVGPGGRLWCSACGPVLECEAEGHEFSPWRLPVLPGGQLACSEFRHCRRCCLDESRPTRRLIGSNPRQGKSALSAQLMARLAAVSGEGPGEVA